MARSRTAKPKRKIEHYTHDAEKRVNNPPVGLVTPHTDRDQGKKTYAYDPLRLSWPMLYRQFGADPAKAGDNRTVQVFRTDCLRELTKIKTA